MKRLLSLILGLCLAVTVAGQTAANTIEVRQRNAAGTAFVPEYFLPTANSLFLFDAAVNPSSIQTSASGRSLLAATALTAQGLGLTNGANIDAWGAKTIYAGTLTITSGKTVNFSNTLAFAGNDGASLNIVGGGTLGALAYLATVGTAQIDNGAVTLVKFQNITTDRLLGRDTAGVGAPEELTVGGGLEFTGTGGIQRSAFTGDVTAPAGSDTTTLATVNVNVGSFGSATQAGTFTVNGKGLITAAGEVTVTPAIGSITGLGTGVGTALGVNVGTAGAVVVNGGALGTPSSGVADNLTGTAAGLTAGNATKLATARTISITGDIAYTSPGFDGSADVTAAAVIQADSVALTTDTTGDYVATVTGDTEIAVSGAGTEGRVVTLAIGAGIARDSEVAAVISDTAYDAATWDAVTTVAASKNAVRDKFESLTKSDVGLGNVDNTSDANKPVSTATQTALDAKVDENGAITGATKTKITYDAKGLVTSGADATTADIADFTNKRYVTDAQLTVIGNTTGTNTGDQTITLTGDVTGTGTGNFAATIAGDAVAFAKMQNIATDRLIGRDTAATGDPEEISLGASLEFGGSGTIQRAALTGDVTAPANSNTTTLATVTVAKGGTNLTSIADAAILATNAANVLTPVVAGANQAIRRNAGNTTWEAFTPGTGDVVGPSSATDNAIARFDTTTGKLIQNSVVTVNDLGAVAGAVSVSSYAYLQRVPNIPARTVATASTWIGRSIELNGWWDVAWSPQLGLFAAVSDDGTNRVSTSPDGIIWTGRTAAAVSTWQGITWSPELGLFVAVAQSGTNQVMTSPDGITWTARAASEANAWRNVAWSPQLGLFAAIADSGTNRVMTSPDGITWTARAASEANSWYGITWSPQLGLFAAVSIGGTNRVMTSPDGITWTARAASEANSWIDITWSPELGLFVAVSYTGTNRVMTSPDGITWTARAASEANSWYAVAWSPQLGLFAAVSNNGTNRVMTSPDGITWTARAASAASPWRGITWSPALGLFAAVGNGDIMNSRGQTFGAWRELAKTAAASMPSAFTVPVYDTSYLVSANVLVTTATSHAFTVTCAYTDEGNTARTLTLTFGLIAGGVTTTSIANANGAVPYMGVPVRIRAKGGTTITLATTGTFTTVTYNVEGGIVPTN